jgi:DNA modification methylase
MKHKNNIWPADKVERRKTDSLVPYARNSRTHSEQQVSQIAASIKEWGWTTPVLIDEEGGIIAGHGRVLAAQKLGIDEVPTMAATGWTKAQKQAYVLADNQLPQNAGWDMDLLSVEMKDLDAEGFDLSLMGFDDDMMANMLNEETEGLTDEDAVPEVPDVPVTVEGDIWVLGKHRLMCGDSTSIDAVDKLMGGVKADMVFTSPPYNANTKAGDGDIFNKRKSKKLYADGYSDNLGSEQYIKFTKDVLEVCFMNTDGFVFWNVSYNANSRNEYIKQIEDRIDFLVEQICWKKSSTIPFKGCLMRDWEPVYIFSTNKQGLNLKNVVSNFWEISNTGSQQENHKACFPVALPEKAIGLVNKNTGIVFEPFSGSGTTLIACEKTGRENRSMELDPKYCDVIIKRWCDFTGKDAINEATGEKFPTIKAE